MHRGSTRQLFLLCPPGSRSATLAHEGEEDRPPPVTAVTCDGLFESSSLRRNIGPTGENLAWRNVKAIPGGRTDGTAPAHALLGHLRGGCSSRKYANNCRVCKLGFRNQSVDQMQYSFQPYFSSIS